MKTNILLLDMDNFFCSIEELRHPELKGKPIVIGGKTKHGVVSSCNKLAKEYGIKAAMPIFQVLKLCPNINILNSDIEYYSLISERINSILKRITHKIEKSSIDEWYIDLNNKTDFFNRDIKEIANTIRYKIEQELNLKCSIGISYNKFLAKIACEHAKPNNIFILDENNFKKYLWPMKIDDMYMVGKKASVIMKKIGINTIKDLATFDNLDFLKSKFGKMAIYYYNCANGIDESIVDYNRKIKSIGHSTKYEQTKYGKDNLIKEIDSHFELCYKRLIDYGVLTNNVVIGIGWADVKKSKSKKISFYTCDKKTLYDIVINLFNKFENVDSFSYLSISFNNVLKKYELESSQNLFSSENESIVDKINKKFSKELVRFGKNK